MCGGALAPQDRQKALDAVHDTPEVDAEDPLPVLERLVLEEVEGRDAGVVDDHIHPTEPFDRRRREPVDCRGIGDVGAYDMDVDVVVAQARSHGVEPAFVDVGEHDRTARRAEGRHDRGADAATRAGDNRDAYLVR